MLNMKDTCHVINPHVERSSSASLYASALGNIIRTTYGQSHNGRTPHTTKTTTSGGLP